MSTEPTPTRSSNSGFYTLLTTLVLVGLKLSGVLPIPWAVALLPLYFWPALAIVAVAALILVLLIAIPVIGVALLVGPLVERLTGRKSDPDNFSIHLSEPMFAEGAKFHDELPADGTEDGSLGDHEGHLFGYVKINNREWFGPDKWYGMKGHSSHRSHDFAFARASKEAASE